MSTILLQAGSLSLIFLLVLLISMFYVVRSFENRFSPFCYSITCAVEQLVALTVIAKRSLAVIETHADKLDAGESELWKMYQVHEKSRLPEKAYSTDAGFDIFTDEDCVIEFGKITHIRCGVRIEMPEHTRKHRLWAIFMVPKSGLATKYGLTLINSPGTIDQGYTGEICAIATLLMQSAEPLMLPRGSKIAQLICSEVLSPNLVPQPYTEQAQIKTTERGENGFGSSGWLPEHHKGE